MKNNCKLWSSLLRFFLNTQFTSWGWHSAPWMAGLHYRDYHLHHHHITSHHHLPHHPLGGDRRPLGGLRHHCETSREVTCHDRHLKWNWSLFIWVCVQKQPLVPQKSHWCCQTLHQGGTSWTLYVISCACYLFSLNLLIPPALKISSWLIISPFLETLQPHLLEEIKKFLLEN